MEEVKKRSLENHTRNRNQLVGNQLFYVLLILGQCFHFFGEGGGGGKE